VRAERPEDTSYARLAGAAAIGAGGLLGGVFGGWVGIALGVLGGLAGALTLTRRLGRRGLRRRALLRTPFPEPWRRVLNERFDHYRRLPPAWRARFEDDVRIFAAELRLTGVEVDVTPEHRLMVAASAVTLSVGWPDYEWDQVTEVLLYPQDFDRDYRFEEPELSGQAHPWGTVLLSLPALEESFADSEDGYHVGLHEFAHLLDVDQSRFDGIPAGMRGVEARDWVAVAEREMEQLRYGRSALDPYGAHDPAEFLAVALEAFFEVPLRIRQRHPELYAILSTYLGQDPAAWDDARGRRIDRPNE
jgi:MtfA peptidase